MYFIPTEFFCLAFLCIYSSGNHVAALNDPGSFGDVLCQILSLLNVYLYVSISEEKKTCSLLE